MNEVSHLTTLTKACHPSCSTCSSATGGAFCTTCSSPKVVQRGFCLDSCPPGTYLYAPGNECFGKYCAFKFLTFVRQTECYPLCTACSTSSNDACTSCVNNLNLINCSPGECGYIAGTYLKGFFCSDRNFKPVILTVSRVQIAPKTVLVVFRPMYSTVALAYQHVLQIVITSPTTTPAMV